MRISTILFIIIFLACASRPEPEWVTSQPKAEGYWFGIGIVKKPFYGDDCREESRNKALAEISAQISIDISASFERVVEEHNLNLDEFAKSVIKTRVENNLPNIENLDFYDSKAKCSFLARLSKSTYYETIERQRRNAVQSALGLLSQAESDFNVQTFTYFNKAISEIIPYMDIPIEEEYPLGSGRIVNLYSYIKVQANKSMDRLILIPVKENIEIKLGFTRDLQMNVKVMDRSNNSPIENIPVLCYIKDKGENTSALSNEAGECIFSIPPITDNKSIQYINYEVNMAEIFQDKEYIGVLPQMAQSTLKVNPPNIYIQIMENNLGEPTINPYIQPVIRDFFLRYFSANFVDMDNADLMINGIVNTRSMSNTPNEYGIYQVFGDITISIINGDTGDMILEKSFTSVQGSDFQSNREAANQSLKKISEKITIDLLPEIIEVIKEL